MTLKILNKKEKAEIQEKLNEQFGIQEIPGELFMIGKEKVFLFSGSFSNHEIKLIDNFTNIERIGFYFAKIDPRIGDIRLSIEGSQIIGPQAKKNIFNVPDDLVENWMKGQELNIKANMKGFVIMKHNDDFLGSGKASEEKIGNFIPKNRRLKERG
jgi:NOL1/NOP2/fmu family ribosome biogenesis protein